MPAIAQGQAAGTRWSLSGEKEEGKEREYGLCDCICGRRSDLCPDTDPDGENEDDAGADHGASRVPRRSPGAFGIYEPFLKWAKAGASVPLLGFGNNLWKGVREMVDEKGFIGIFLGGFKNCALGLSAALVFSYIAALITQPKMKKH